VSSRQRRVRCALCRDRAANVRAKDRIDRPHDPAEDVSIAFDDPELAIPWPLPVTTMSQRDQRALPLADAAKLL